MGRLGLALKVLFSGDAARLAAEALSGAAPAAIEQQMAAPEAPPAPVRSEAVTLLAALQRDARFVDFIQEPIDGYSDAQVGAAVRDVHRGCAEVVQRMFAVEPVVDQEEDSTVEVADPSSGRWRLTGNVGQGSGAAQGTLAHPGWQAAHVRVPEWNGNPDDAQIVAPAEVQLS